MSRERRAQGEIERVEYPIRPQSPRRISGPGPGLGHLRLDCPSVNEGYPSPPVHHLSSRVTFDPFGASISIGALFKWTKVEGRMFLGFQVLCNASPQEVPGAAAGKVPGIAVTQGQGVVKSRPVAKWWSVRRASGFEYRYGVGIQSFLAGRIVQKHKTNSQAESLRPSLGFRVAHQGFGPSVLRGGLHAPSRGAGAHNIRGLINGNYEGDLRRWPRSRSQLQYSTLHFSHLVPQQASVSGASCLCMREVCTASWRLSGKVAPQKYVKGRQRSATATSSSEESIMMWRAGAGAGSVGSRPSTRSRR